MFYIYEPLSRGKTCTQVVQLQRSLPTWVSSELLVADGAFGEKTEQAVRAYQSAMGLTVDGVVGEATASALGLWVELVEGFDISHWNTILWDSVPQKIKFVEVKATEGATYVDPSFYDSVQSARDLGIQAGAYHFTKFNNPPLREAANFLEAAHKARVDSVTLDLEYRVSELTSSEIESWVMTFMRSCEAFFDPSNIRIYTSRNYLHEKGLQSAAPFARYKLWAADWNNQPLALPWKSWDTWQYTNAGAVDWATAPIDLDVRVEHGRL